MANEPSTTYMDVFTDSSKPLKCPRSPICNGYLIMMRDTIGNPYFECSECLLTFGLSRESHKTDCGCVDSNYVNNAALLTAYTGDRKYVNAE